MRITFGEGQAPFRKFLVGATLGLGESADTAGVYGTLVYGDDTHGIPLSEGHIALVTRATEEDIHRTVHWDGDIPLSGGANRHLAGWIYNYSGNERKFALHGYFVEEVPDRGR